MGDPLKPGILFTFLVLILLARGQYSVTPNVKLNRSENRNINKDFSMNNSPDTFINSLLYKYSALFFFNS